MIAYLSGAMEYAENEGQDWRIKMTEWLQNELDHTAINPVEDTSKLVAANNTQDYRNWKSSDPSRFVEFVRKAIDNDLNSVVNRVDYLICLWNKAVLKGGGTHGEVTMAYYFNKPVYLINQLDGVELSGWIMSCATEIFTDFKSLQSRLLYLYRDEK